MPRPGRVRRPFGRAIALSLIAAMFACARTSDPAPSPTGAETFPIPASPVVVRVHNKHWSDVNIALDVGGQRTRLGLVTAVTSGSFRVPDRLLTQGRPFRLIADPIGATTILTSETVYARPGQVVEWTLESDLKRSTLAIF